jgi:hypothetical protein
MPAWPKNLPNWAPASPACRLEAVFGFQFSVLGKRCLNYPLVPQLLLGNAIWREAPALNRISPAARRRTVPLVPKLHLGTQIGEAALRKMVRVAHPAFFDAVATLFLVPKRILLPKTEN